MRNSIMTEKIARRGVRVRSDYSADLLEQATVRDRASRHIFALPAASTVEEMRLWLASGVEGSGHQGYPLVDAAGKLVGLLTRRDLLAPSAQGGLRTLVRRAPVVVYGESSLRQALDLMVRARVGRLVVVERANPGVPIGILTRSDILGAHVGEHGPATAKRTSVIIAVPREAAPDVDASA